MNKKRVPNKFDLLYLVNEGVNVRGTPSDSKYCTVIAVGRKYFTIETISKYPTTMVFHIDNWNEKSEYVSNWGLYENDVEYKDMVEAQKLNRLIDDCFTYGNSKFDVVTLRKVATLLDIKLED